MSSHHIVRDEQEPALVILSSKGLERELVGSLLEWSPTVIVIEEAAKVLMEWGIKIDVVLSPDPSSQLVREVMELQAPVKVISYSANEYPAHIALHFLNAKKYHAVNLVLGLQPDELPEHFHEMEPFLEKLNIVFFLDQFKGVMPKSEVFEKWVPAGQKFAIIPLNDSVTLDLSGFEENHAALAIKKKIELASKEGVVSFRTIEGRYFLFENL
jgi:thiamine pyrophosphokinase